MKTSLYQNALTIAEALQEYFKRSGFDESNYTDTWVKLPVYKFNLILPNIGPRRIAVRLHDIDHVLTEYKTDWPGEWQIGAYELATGCGRHWIAWIINSQAFLAGVVGGPKLCLKAFARGRRSKGIYGYSREELVSMKVGELRTQTTASEDSVQITMVDRIGFAVAVILSVIVNLGPPIAIGAVIYNLACQG